MHAPEQLEAADAIIRAGARLGARGLIVAAEGNLSIRLGDQLLVTPAGRRKDELTVADLLLVPIDAGATDDARTANHGLDPEDDAHGPRPSSDIAVHRAIYRARPDILAIAHAHLAASLGLTLAANDPTRMTCPRRACSYPACRSYRS